MNESKTTPTLNSLLRGELSAVETYDQALAKAQGEPFEHELGQLRAEHVSAAAALRQRVIVHGGEPESGSGAWGAFARAVEGTSKLFGNVAAVAALRQGEKQGASEYEAALLNADLAEDCRHLIATRLLLETRKHVLALDGLAHG